MADADVERGRFRWGLESQDELFLEVFSFLPEIVFVAPIGCLDIRADDVFFLGAEGAAKVLFA